MSCQFSLADLFIPLPLYLFQEREVARDEIINYKK